MSRQTLSLTADLQRYMLDVSLREPDVLRRLREETARHPQAEMQIAPEQGQFMALLARLVGARRALEVGVFTGYSALAVALALPPDGQVIALDVSEEFTAVARRYWREAGVGHKVDLRLGPAIETLDGLLAAGQAGTFDLAFIDADKPGYDGYYERALALVRPGGLILLDNMLRGGDVADPGMSDPGLEAIRALNRKLHGDARIDLSLLPVADGLTLARKREAPAIG
jgi:predicted O-methyltransferase YrrM